MIEVKKKEKKMEPHGNVNYIIESVWMYFSFIFPFLNFKKKYEIIFYIEHRLKIIRKGCKGHVNGELNISEYE